MRDTCFVKHPELHGSHLCSPLASHPRPVSFEPASGVSSHPGNRLMHKGFTLCQYGAALSPRWRLISSFLPSFLPSILPSFLLSILPSFLLSIHPSFLPSFLTSFLPSFLPSYLPLIPCEAAPFSLPSGALSLPADSHFRYRRSVPRVASLQQ